MILKLNLAVFLGISIGILCSGCNTSPAETDSQTGSTVKKEAKSAWQAVSLALNISNPLYYAKKAAKYEYNNLKDTEDE